VAANQLREWLAIARLSITIGIIYYGITGYCDAFLFLAVYDKAAGFEIAVIPLSRDD
jgi:hypothetical protein